MDPLGRSIDSQFRDFHAANPGVYRELARLAREAKQAGHIRVGIKMLYELTRWKFQFSPMGAADFKLPNNFHSRYARLLMQQEPDLAGMFELHQLKTA